MMIKLCSIFWDILLLAVFFTFSHGQNEEPAILNHTVPDNDYPSDYDDYPSLDYYGDDREGRSLGNDADDYSTNAFHAKDDAFLLKQLRSTIPGTPGTDYSLYQSVPDTSFECRNQQQPGFYGDVEAQCQVFHICQQGNRQDSFLCPIGTVFNQRTFICDWWFNFKCEDTPIYFHLNALFYEMTNSTTPKSQQVIHKIRRSRHMSSSLKGMMSLGHMEIHKMDEDGMSKRKRIRNLFMPRTTRSKKVWNFFGQLPLNDERNNSSRSQKAIEQDDSSSATPNTVNEHKSSYNQPIFDYAISALASTASDSTEPNKSIKEGDLEESTTDSSDGDNIDYNITAVDISTVDGFVTSTHHKLGNNSYLFSTSRDPITTKQQSDSDGRSSTKMPLPPDSVYQNSNLTVVEDTEWNLRQNNYSNNRAIDSTGSTSHRKRFALAALEFPSNSVTKTLEDGESTTTFSLPTTVSSLEATPISEFDIRILPLASPLPLNFVAKTIEDKDLVTLTMKEKPSKSNGTWIVGKQNHISVSVAIGSSTSRSHLQWKRQSDAKKIRKFHLKNLKRGNDNLNFRDRHPEIKRSRSRIMWIPSRNGTFEPRNHWQKVTDYLKERVPVDISLNKDVPVDISMKKDAHAEVNLKKDVSFDVNLNKDASVKINLKELPFDVNLKENAIVDESLKKDGPVDVSLKKDMPFDVNLKKVFPIDVRLKEDVPVNVILKKDIPVGVNLKEDIPIGIKKPSLAKATITDLNLPFEMKKMVIHEYAAAQTHNPREVKEEFGNEQLPKGILHSKLLQAAVANNLDETTPIHFLSDIEQMTMDTSENAFQSTTTEEDFLPKAMEETKIHSTGTGSNNSVQKGNDCKMICIKLLRNMLKPSNATQNENNSVAHAELNAESSADKTTQVFSRRDFLGLSSSEHFTVKYDVRPNCNKDQEKDKFLVRGWSVIIDSGHVTKEKTVKKRNCKSILNDSEIILMHTKTNRGFNTDYDTADITSRWPQKLPGSKHKDLEFGSMDQQYWLGLVKNWLKAIPSSGKGSNNDNKLRRDNTEADLSYPSYSNDHSAQNSNRQQPQNSNWNRNHPSDAASWSSKYQNSRIADSSDIIKYSGDLDNSETRTDHEARNIATKFSQIADDSTDATKQTFSSYSVTEHEPLEQYVRDSWIQNQNTRHLDSATAKDTFPEDSEKLFHPQKDFDRFAKFQNVNVGMQNKDESRKNFENVQSNIRTSEYKTNWTSQSIQNTKEWLPQPKSQKLNWSTQPDNYNEDWSSKSENQKSDLLSQQEEQKFRLKPETEKKDWSFRSQNGKMDWLIQPEEKKQYSTSHTEGSGQDWFAQSEDRRRDWSAEPEVNYRGWGSQFSNERSEWASQKEDNKKVWPENHKRDKTSKDNRSDRSSQNKGKQDWSSQPEDKKKDWYLQAQIKKQNSRPKTEEQNWFPQTKEETSDWSSQSKYQKNDWSQSTSNTLDWSEGNQNPDWSTEPEDKKRDWSPQADNRKGDWSSQPNQKPNLSSQTKGQNREWSSEGKDQKQIWLSQAKGQKQHWPSEPDSQKQHWPSKPDSQKQHWPSKPDSQKRYWSSRPRDQKQDWSAPSKDEKQNWSLEPDNRKNGQGRDWPAQTDYQKGGWSTPSKDRKRDWSTQARDQTKDWSSQPDNQKRDWSSQPDNQKRDWSSQQDQKRDWFTQTKDQKRNWSSQPDQKRDWTVKANDEKRDWSSPLDMQKRDWSPQPNQKPDWSSQPDQKRDWSTQARDQKEDRSSQPDQKRDWSLQLDQKRDWSSQPDPKRRWTNQGKDEKLDWASQADTQKRDWFSQPDHQKRDWSSQPGNQKRDWSSEPDNQKRNWYIQPNNQKRDWSSQQGNQKQDWFSQSDQKRDWSTQARDQKQDWSSQPDQKRDWSTQARDQKPGWSSQSDPKQNWSSQANSKTEARPWNSDNRRSDDSLSFRFPSDTTDKEQSDWSWRSEKRLPPKEPQWPIKSPDYPSDLPANVLKGDDSTRNDWSSGKGGALKGESSWPTTIAEESSWQSDSPQGDTAWLATIVDKGHTKPFEKGIQQNGSRDKSTGLWKGDDGSSKSSPENTQDKRSSISTKTRKQYEVRSPRKDSDTRFAAGKENFPKGTSQMKINWPSDSNKHQMQWPSDTPASRGDKKADNAWSKQARTDATIVNGYPRDSDSSHFGSKGQSSWPSDSIPQPGSGQKDKKRMDSGSWNQEANPLPEQRRKGKWNFRSDAIDFPNESKGSPEQHLSKPVLKDSYPTDKTHMKGNAGKKEEKIIWSVQISSNGKPTNGWVPITLRPNLRPRNGGGPKSGGRDKDRFFNNKDWGNKPIHSWNASKVSKSSMSPSIKLDIVTSAAPEVIEASDQHMFYIPTVNRRYKRDTQQHLGQKKYTKESNTTSYEVVTNPKKLGRNYHKDRFYLARADISFEGDFLKEIGRSEVFQEQRSELGKMLSKPNENESRPFYSFHNADESDVRNQSHLKEFQQEISSQVQWSVPFDFSKVPVSGWVPIVNVKTFTKDKSLKPETAVKEFTNISSGALHANAMRENITQVLEKPQNASEGSNGAEILYPEEEVENFSQNASNELTQIQPAGENKQSDLRNETEFETGNSVEETRMKIGNETLRILPFSNIMKQLAEHDIKSTESWNIPLTSAPKVYSLKLVNDHTTSLKSNVSNVWTFSSGPQSSWVLVRNDNNNSNSKRDPHSDQNSIINNLRLASGSQQNSSQHYRIIIGNRTNVVRPSELSGGKIFRGREDYSVGGSLFFNSSVSQKDSGWVPLLRGVGSVVPRNITQSQRTKDKV